jgi:hypothetical protein
MSLRSYGLHAGARRPTGNLMIKYLHRATVVKNNDLTLSEW